MTPARLAHTPNADSSAKPLLDPPPYDRGPQREKDRPSRAEEDPPNLLTQRGGDGSSGA